MTPASSLFLGLCLLTLLLSTPSSHAAGPVTSCCLKTQDTKVPLDRLVKYQRQNVVCAVEAVQFRTVKGRTICSHPSNGWAQNAMRYLDALKAARIPFSRSPKA